MLLDTLFTNPAIFFVTAIALVLSIGIHEFAHVLSAYLQGDSTGQRMGRLTINPINHIEPWGMVAMLLAGIGWGRPAPFNPANLRFRRWGTFLVAIAGPLANVVFVVLFGYAAILLQPSFGSTNLMIIFFSTMAVLNASLAVFNLLPIPPLDGSRVLSVILGVNHPVVQWLERYGFILLIALLFLGRGLIGAWISGGVSILFTLVGLK